MPLDVPTRERAGWWLLVGLLTAILLYVLASVVGAVVLGLFVYYVVRPLHRRLAGYTNRHAAAAATLVLAAMPLVALLGYVVLAAVRELLSATGRPVPVHRLLGPLVDAEALSAAQRRVIVTLLDEPVRLLADRPPVASRLFDVAATVFGATAFVLFHLFVAVALAYFLLQDGGRLAGWVREHLLGEGTLADAYLRAVDHDLETVYLGNVFTVAMVALLAALAYNGYNYLAPAVVEVPLPTALALATGLASFVPIVVGKLVYVPLTGYLAYAAVEADGGLLVYPLALFGVALLFLDLLPLAVLRPYLSGREIHTGAVMFAYLLGTATFGWYGLFLGPLLLVLVVQAAQLVLPELVHGTALTDAASAPTALGTDPEFED